MEIELSYESGVKVLKTDRLFRDGRGFFAEIKREEAMIALLGAAPSTRFVQTNFSKSSPFVLRGMHYQLRGPVGDRELPAQGKLMRCIAGKIYHACVDVRAGSKTFGKAFGHVLDDVENRAVWVPPGFAAGFFAFENGATVLYEMTAEYEPKLERAVLWSDEAIDIKWPFRVNAGLVISAKDKANPKLAAIDTWK